MYLKTQTLLSGPLPEYLLVLIFDLIRGCLVIDPNHLFSFLILFIRVHKHWNLSVIQSIFDRSSAEEILKIKISRDPGFNYIWTPSCSGRFSTNSAYLSINDLSDPDPLWKSLWKLRLNDRFRLFVWKIAWDILLTSARINSIFSTNSPIYLSSAELMKTPCSTCFSIVDLLEVFGVILIGRWIPQPCSLIII